MGTIIRPRGPGIFSQFLRGGVDSGANWSQIDEETPNGDIDYNAGLEIGAKDTVTFESIPSASGDVASVTLRVYAKAGDASGGSIRFVLRIAGVNYFSPDLELSSIYDKHEYTWSTNPATSNPFTVSEVNNLEAGYEAL